MPPPVARDRHGSRANAPIDRPELEGAAQEPPVPTPCLAARGVTEHPDAGEVFTGATKAEVLAQDPSVHLERTPARMPVNVATVDVLDHSTRMCRDHRRRLCAKRHASNERVLIGRFDLLYG